MLGDTNNGTSLPGADLAKSVENARLHVLLQSTLSKHTQGPDA